jgi:hypothetical protein
MSVTVTVIDNNAIINVSTDTFASARAVQAAAEAEAAALTATTAKDDAEDAAVLSTQQAILSSAARDDAEAAKIAAQSAVIDAEAARDDILNKAEINLTTAGNVLEADGTIFKSINKRKQAFLADTDPEIWDVYDSCHRPDSSSLGTSDSGHVWTTGAHRIHKNFINGTSNSGVIATQRALIDTLLTGGSGFLGKCIQVELFNLTSTVGNIANITIAYVDSNNFIEVALTSNLTVIRKFISGVSTDISTVSVTTGARNFLIKPVQIIVTESYVSVNRGDRFNALNYGWVAGSDELNMILTGGMNKTGFQLRTTVYARNFRVSNLGKSI